MSDNGQAALWKAADVLRAKALELRAEADRLDKEADALDARASQVEDGHL